MATRFRIDNNLPIFPPNISSVKTGGIFLLKCVIIHVYKEINVVADLLSNEGLSLNFNTTWVLHTGVQRGYWYARSAMESQSDINAFERRRL